MATATRILVVDDDSEIRKLLGRYLREQGFKVSLAGSLREAKERLATEAFELAVLDLLLPDGSGLDLCRLVRTDHPQTCIILVTAMKEDVDRIIGLELGADDYVGKPFNPRELLARIRAILRRASTTDVAAPAGDTFYRFADFVADAATRAVEKADGQLIELTGAEFDLMKVFLDRPGRVLSRDQLLDLTQGRQAGPFDRSIDVLMSRLRRKLGEGSDDAIFKTIRNGGYQLAVRVERTRE